MSGRIRNHLRTNVVGYIALFLVLTGGTAYALDGSNTVFSDDIANGEVKTADIGAAAVNTGRLANDSVTTTKIKDGEVHSSDLAPLAVTTGRLGNDSVTSAKVLDDSLGANDLGTESVGSDEVQNESLTNADLATDSVQATEVADNSLDSGEIIDFGLSNEDIGVLEAEVNADGTLASSDHFGTTSSNIGTGSYAVDFGINVSFCTPVVSQGEAGVGGAGGAIMGVTDRSANSNAFFVTTRDAAGAGINTAFHIVVVC
jgi:hypothetical protein